MVSAEAKETVVDSVEEEGEEGEERLEEEELADACGTFFERRSRMFVDDRERCRKAEKHVVFIIVDAVVIDVVAVIVTAAAAAAVVAESTTIAATLVVVAVVDVAFPPTSKISQTSLPPATHLAESTFTLST